MRKAKKDAEPFKDIRLMLDLVELERGKTSCVLRPANGKWPDLVEKAGEDPRAIETDRRALDALVSFGDKGASFSEWVMKAGLQRSTFKRARTRLLGARKVTQTGKRYLSVD